jgi:hypothetical protein
MGHIPLLRDSELALVVLVLTPSFCFRVCLARSSCMKLPAGYESVEDWTADLVRFVNQYVCVRFGA